MKTLTPVLVLVVAISCSREKPAVAPQEEVGAATSDEAAERLNQMAEIRERNRTQPSFTTEELHELMTNPQNSAAIKRWRETHSYYALLEISEGILEPELGRMRRPDVEELLGKGDPDYPNSHGHILHYGGDRRIPVGSHLLITFDEGNVAYTIDWVSE